MAQIEWTLTLDTGLPRIDEQHKQLVVYSNDLIQAMKENRGDAVLEALFEKLLDYTDSHFSEEEEFMESVGYPDLEAQRTAHRRLLNEVGHFREKLLSGVPVTPEQTLEFINGWIIKHIMIMDSKIGEFITTRAKG
ncbi:bacteriohemerythrin [Pseudodesulfovibrio sp.]|uniref:bacteriohemerythrin n=1 Tax=unclassified Pseudodesulfovibrio TaxID=2661612 RepID=UPI003AFF7766